MKIVDKNQYFYRILAFTRLEGGVSIIDKYNPEKPVSLEPWLGTVVSLADGQHTIEELISLLRAQYGAEVPAELERTVESVIERLVTANAVMLSDAPHTLPYHLSRPIEELNPDEAKASMAESGYLVKETLN